MTRRIIKPEPPLKKNFRINCSGCGREKGWSPFRDTKRLCTSCLENKAFKERKDKV